MRSIGPNGLDDHRESEDVFVLDIRPADEYDGNHIEGSFNAPVYHDLRAGETAALDPYLDEIPDDTDVVTVCKAGVVARTATTYLDEKGYDAATLSGGYAGWRQYENNTLLYRLLTGVERLLP
ncbi:rhodanese-like domain-containing protein [Haloarchaeobius sp. DFWS5]|uniref:rhodanese-like domain-containing protein n=1 Tax=Haloarchaeobius sp. DFWS5 TaxID=3446114 RepID=UPI003EBEF4B2